MRFFRLEFDSAPATEREDTEYVVRQVCDACGLRYLPVSNRYLVPEDTMIRLSLESEESELPDIFEAAGMLICRRTLARQLVDEKISGFEIREVSIVSWISEVCLSDFAWLSVTGRCECTPLWQRVIATCSQCGSDIFESVQSSTRILSLIEPFPDMDIFRGRERTAGIMISENLKSFLEKANVEHLTYKAIPAISTEFQIEEL